MKQGGVLDRVLQLALNKLNCPPVRAQALRTLGDLVRNCAENRNVLGSAVIDGWYPIHCACSWVALLNCNTKLIPLGID
jgi:hypothetical protein